MGSPCGNWYRNSKSLLLCKCLKCGKQVLQKDAQNGCPSCQYHLFKVAVRGTGYPSAFTWDIPKDPYSTQWVPGNGQGMTPALVTPSTEETSGGLGTRFRGKGSPADFSSKSDNYDKQRKNDIPSSDHMFVDGMPIGEGVSDGTFFDPSSPLSAENMVAEELYSGRSEPVGPCNMQKFKAVFDRVRRQQKGT